MQPLPQPLRGARYGRLAGNRRNPSLSQRKNKPKKIAQPRQSGRRSPPKGFGALNDHENFLTGRPSDQAGTEFACFTRAEREKNAIAVSAEILPAPKISTMRETIRNAKGAAAMNLSGSEKKESSASRSPIT